MVHGEIDIVFDPDCGRVIANELLRFGGGRWNWFAGGWFGWGRPTANGRPEVAVGEGFMAAVDVVRSEPAGGVGAHGFSKLGVGGVKINLDEVPSRSVIHREVVADKTSLFVDFMIAS